MSLWPTRAVATCLPAGLLAIVLGLAHWVSNGQARTSRSEPLLWSAPKTIDHYPVTYNVLETISCPTTRFCVAADNTSHVFLYNGSSWSPPEEVDLSNITDAVSVACASQVFCELVAGDGNAFTWNGASWSTPVHVDPHTHYIFGPVSCPSINFCAAVDNDGYSFLYRRLAWSRPARVGTISLADVSCASSHFCVALDATGVLIWRGRSWSASQRIVSEANHLVAVSCRTASFCVAVEQAGDALIWRGRSWSAATRIDSPRNLLSAVSCPTTTFCVAVDATGHALTWHAGAWSARVVIDARAASSQRDAAGYPFVSVTGVSCASSTHCVAIDSAGRVVEGAAPARSTMTPVLGRPAPSRPASTDSTGITSPATIPETR